MKRTAAVGAVALVALLAVAAPSASAAIQTVQPTVVSAVPSTDTPAVNDGIVDAIAKSGSTVVVGGSFTSVSPPASASTVAEPGLAAFTAGTGALVSGFAPTLDGTVNAIIPGPTAGTVFVGGKFTKVDGVHSNLALISTTTGGIARGWTSPSMNGEVNSLVLSGRHLFVGGYFTSFDGSRKVGLAVLDATTGRLKQYATPDFAGHHNYGRKCDPTTASCARADTGIKSMDINPGRTRLVAVGNFTSVDGRRRDQVALIDLSATAATVDSSWATDAYSAECKGKSFDTYVRDVQFSPDGSYFVIAATGGGAGSKNSDGSQNSCDAAARYDTSVTGSAVRPVWIDYTGNDTLLSVAITGTAVYVGGHQRWVNNSDGHDDAREGAVPRPGIVALDPTNGMPLAWNPGRNPRGFGAAALLATSDGLYVGSDTDYIGNRQYLRKELAFFPLSGGTVLPPTLTGLLPGKVFLLGDGAEAENAEAVSWNGRSDPGTPAKLTDVDWSTVRGAFEVNNEIYYGDTDGTFYHRSFDGATFGPAIAVDPYDDPAWDSVQTGSGQTYRGEKPNFYRTMSSLTSMFYSAGRVYYTRAGKPDLYWRWFEPDSGVIGADQFTAKDSVDWSNIAGAFLSGTGLFYANAATGVLHRVSFVAGRVSGTPTVANSTINWASAGAFVGSSDTTTSLAVMPGAPLSQREPMTLTATVGLASDETVHPAGAVRFTDGSLTLGTAVVDGTGEATLTTDSAPPTAPGGAVLTALFTSSDGSSQTSASAPVTYTIDPVATAPRLSGRPRVGARERCREPAVPGETVRFSWQLGSRRVATGPSYGVPARAHRKALVCSVTVSMGGGPASAATSDRVRVALGKALVNRRRPRISGGHRVGAVVAVSHGAWSPTATRYSYQWYSGARRVRRATTRFFALTKADLGARISARVVAHRPGYASGARSTKRVNVAR